MYGLKSWLKRICVGCLHVYMYTTFLAIRLDVQTNDANRPRLSPCKSLVVYIACPVVQPKRTTCAFPPYS
jgi:hypothetical protein